MSSVGYERQQSARCVCTGAGVLRSRAPFRSGGGVDERPACEASCGSVGATLPLAGGDGVAAVWRGLRH